MRTRGTLTGIFASVSLVVIGWQFGTAALAPATTTSALLSRVPAAKTSAAGSSGAANSSSASAAPSTAGGTGGAAAPSTSGAKDGKYSGVSVGTPYGDVQVQVVVSGGKITDVVALQLTNDGGRSVQISNYAAPILRSEALQAQSANVSSVSGATYTSDGYLNSLQSALDKAGL